MIQKDLIVNIFIIYFIKNNNCLFMEKWKKIDEIPYVEVSNMGRFRTIDRTIEKIRLGKKVVAHKKGSLRKLSKDNNGYLKLIVCSKNGTKGFVAHRLVAKYFLPDYDDKLEVDHINDCRDDNRVENLRMVTRLENVRKKTTLGKIISNLKNEGIKRRIPIVCTDLDGNFIKEYEYMSQVKADGFSIGCISQCCNNKFGKNGNVIKNKIFMRKEDYEKMLGEENS